MISPTIATYDQYHEVYDTETVDFWNKFPKETIHEFVSRLGGKRVLDLGSGPGRDALMLREAGLDVVCLDASSEMVKRTQSLGFESVQEDMRKLNFPDDSFDGVWAYTSLLHIKKTEVKKVLGKVNKLIKPKGVLLVGMIEGDFNGDVESVSMPGSKRYFRYYSEQELKKLVEGEGFEFEYQGRYRPHSRIYLSQIFCAKS